MPSPSSTFVLQLRVPREITLEGRCVDRDEFFGWLWRQFGKWGLLGIHEGTVLSEQAAEQGFETESFTVDVAQAPRERDWIGAQGRARVEAYFASEGEARAARERLSAALEAGIVGPVSEQKPQDWDAEWKKSFLNASEGVFVPPFWRILPAWVGSGTSGACAGGERPLLINPGAGFGTGTHETTQLCLQAVAEFAQTRGPGLLARTPVLDFGSGSGILAIGAALLGARVDAVEIDELAVENARENARLNGVEARIRFSRSLKEAAAGERGPARYPLVIANILRPVLIEFAPELARRLAPGGWLVLSGLVAADVAQVERAYAALLDGRRPRVAERGDWRAVVWGAGGRAAHFT